MSYEVMLDRRIQRLEKQQAQAGALVADNQWYEFLVAPSCPPDKRLHIRGGIVSPSGRWGWIMGDDFIPDITCDFENDSETGLDLIFSNANYYLPFILAYYGDWAAYRTVIPDILPIFDCVTGTEVETAVEAEAQIDAFLNGYEQWYYYRVPLWGVVLKNAGVAGRPYEIMPIDRVNRGRSYMYRDARSNGGIFP